MKILLTAPPKTGKSTVVEKFIKNYLGKKIGVLTKEIRDDQNSRVGFKSVNLNGQEKVFMHVSEIDSDIIVGDKYKVDINAIDNFVVSEISQPVDKDTVIIIDEIGRAQSVSQKFLDTIDKLLNSDNNLLGTIVFDDEEWARKFKLNKNILLIEVSELNRDFLPDILKYLFENSESYNSFSVIQKEGFDTELFNLLQSNNFDSIKNLIDKSF